MGLIKLVIPNLSNHLQDIVQDKMNKMASLFSLKVAKKVSRLFETPVKQFDICLRDY